MNSPAIVIEEAKVLPSAAALVEQLEEPWFSEPTPSSRRTSAAPPVVHVGEFLGDPLADAWLR